ncbi:MAG: hypothetical protein Q9203_004506 [Teloschistes exilis]
MSTEPAMTPTEEPNTSAETNTAPILPLPTENDAFWALARKMQALAAVVIRGESVAVRTGYRATTMAGKDPEAVALEGMKDLERVTYLAWKTGRRPAPFDFTNLRGILPTTKMTDKEYQDRAAALSIMYGVPDITPAQAFMWTQCESRFIPCMKAIMRVERQKVAMTGGVPNLTPIELGDLQTLKKVLAVTAATVQKGKTEIRGFTRQNTIPGNPRIKTLQHDIARATQSIADNSRILQARLRELREKKSGGQQ